MTDYSMDYEGAQRIAGLHNEAADEVEAMGRSCRRSIDGGDATDALYSIVAVLLEEAGRLVKLNKIVSQQVAKAVDRTRGYDESVAEGLRKTVEKTR